MNEFRCGACNRKLGEGEFTQIMIKCPRCGTMNNLRALRPLPECPSAPMKESAMNEKHSTTQAPSGQPVRGHRGI